MKGFIRKLATVGLVVLILALPITTFAQTIISNEAEEHILSELRRANIPNAAVAVMQNGETSYIFKDSTQDTLFQIGSVTKSFTGFGVLLLEDMGLLSVSDPVNRHLPWFDVRYNDIPVTVTIYNLLQHRSGLTSDERLFPMAKVTETTDEFIARLIGLELAFRPSTRHIYGNINYIILGLIIEAVSGQSYDEFMTQQVLHPLGLHNTFTNMERAHETGRVIGGNRLRFLQPVSWNPPIHPTSIPTGWIYSSITDMVRWADIHLGTADVSEQFARVAQRSHENIGSVDFFTHGDYSYTAGWYVSYGNNRIRHNGSTPGYSASFRIYPHTNTAVIVLGNLAHGAVPFGAFVSDVLGGEPFDSVEMEFFAILDVIYTVLTALGAVYVGLFIRLVVKLIKRRNDGEMAKRRRTFKMTWIIDPIISVVALVLLYVGPSMTANMSYEFVRMYSPASYAFAIAVAWVAVVYSLCSLFIKIFMNSR